MGGRMIHVRKNGEYVRQAQAYDARGRVSVMASCVRGCTDDTRVCWPWTELV